MVFSRSTGVHAAPLEEERAVWESMLGVPTA
jgi:hypothetical protein